MKLAEALVAIADLALLTWLARSEGVGTPGALTVWCLVAIAAAIVVARKWPFGALAVLVVSSAMPRLTNSVFNLHVRPEHVAIAIVLLSTAFAKHRQWCYANFEWYSFDYALLAYVGTTFVTSALTSPSPALTLRWATMSAVSIGAYFLVRFLLREERSLEHGFRCLLWVGAIESAIGIVCFLSNRVFGTQFGVAAEQYGAMPGTHGTQYEANLFGAYAACCAILFLVKYLQSERSGRSWYLAGLSITAAATMVSLSRAAMLSLIAVSGLVMWLTFRRRQLSMRRTLAFAAAAGVVFVVAGSPFLSFVEERFASIDLSEFTADAETQLRLVQIAAAGNDIREHPLWGTGTSSLQLTFDSQDYVVGPGGADDPGAWISNTPVRVLHDTGIIGLACFVAFLTLLLMATRRTLKKTTGPARTLIFALSASLAVYAITFQATEATILAFPWVHLGMLAGAVTSSPNV